MAHLSIDTIIAELDQLVVDLKVLRDLEHPSAAARIDTIRRRARELITNAIVLLEYAVEQ
jgi:hypothetical protein